MTLLQPYETFDALLALQVEVSEDNIQASRKKAISLDLSNELVLVDEKILLDSLLVCHLLDDLCAHVCVPEVVLDKIDKDNHYQQDEGRLFHCSMLVERYRDFRFQRVDEYDMPFIKEHNLSTASFDFRLILAAASFYQQSNKHPYKKVVVLSSCPEIKCLAKVVPNKFEVFESVKEYERVRSSVLN